MRKGGPTKLLTDTWSSLFRGSAFINMYVLIIYIINRPDVARAVLQTPVLFINYNGIICGNIFKTLSLPNCKSQGAEIENVHPPLCVTCHMSCVTCHVSCVTCQQSHVVFFSLLTHVELVSRWSVINGPIPSSLFSFHWYIWIRESAWLILW